MFKEPSTFLTGNGVRRVRSVKAFLTAKSWLMIIPSAPLSRRARALICLPDCFPIKDTLIITERERILHIVPRGTGSESSVLNKVMFLI